MLKDPASVCKKCRGEALYQVVKQFLKRDFNYVNTVNDIIFCMVSVHLLNHNQ